MPFSVRSDSELESALDSLGDLSAVRDIPFVLNPRLKPPTQLLAQVQTVLDTPMPNIDALVDDSRLDGSLERQVLKQLENVEKERALKEEKAKKEYEEYLAKKKKMAEEEEEKRRQEEKEEEEKRIKALEEEKKKEAEKQEMDNKESSEQTETIKQETMSDSEEQSSSVTPEDSNSKSESASVTRHTVQQERMANLSLKEEPSNIQQRPPQTLNKINYSDFEGDMDPFQSVELKTINEFQELAAVLGQTNRVQSAAAQQTQAYPGTHHQVPYQAYPQNPFSQQRFPYPAYPSAQPPQQMSSFPHTSHMLSNVPNHPMPPATFSPNYHQFPDHWKHPEVPSLGNSSGGLKSSKSYGDITKEIKKEEARAGNQTHVNKEVEQVRKKSSITPPPRVSNVLGPATSSQSRTLDDWIPWPDLDGKRAEAVEDPFKELSTERRSVCQRISEMGFSRERVVSVCKGLDTSDTQKIVNFCLLVDKFSSEPSLKALSDSDIEHVLLLYPNQTDDTRPRRHMEAFAKLKDLGFDPNEVHKALKTCDCDHDKALEILLK